MVLMMHFLQDKPNTEFQPAYPNRKKKPWPFIKKKKKELHMYDSNNMFMFFKNNFSLLSS